MWWYFLGHGMTHQTIASKKGETTTVVRCEMCGRSYAYELERTGEGSANTLFGGGRRVATQRAAENLQKLLAVGIEVIPCPACGWYQSHMLPKARRLHRRWMLYVGQCLTIGVIPVAIIGCLINGINEHEGKPSIPWPLFLAVIAGLFVVGIAMFIWKYNLAQSYDPNDEDVEARKFYGQSLAALLSEQGAKNMEAPPQGLS